MSAPLVEVDRYVLCDPIAVGGMATVYFARQRGAAGFSKAVAIKRMRPDLVHQREFAEMFVDEARLASRVRHANVVSVTDVVSSGDELLLVMDYFPGESLARLIGGERRVPPDIAVAIVSDVLHGLHAAHEAVGDEGEPLGIVHRDVSPQNTLVCIDGIARVLDFGIARAAGQLHATDEGKTRGKAGYSAPEQLRGGAVTRKIDVFAACVMLWEMLVGRRLFDGETQAQVITAVLTEPIEPPGIYVPSLSEELDDVIMRGLDRNPEKRPATALDLAAELEKAVTPARPAAVRAWLMELAEPELQKRDEIVRRIQANKPIAIPQADITTPDAITGSMATSRSPSLAPTVPRRSRTLPIAAAILLLLAIVGGAAAFTRRTPPAPPVAATTATNEAPSSAAAPGSAPIASAVASPSEATSLATSTAPAASASTSSKPPKRPPHVGAPAPAAKKPNCDPPYYKDAQGHQIFRTECL